MKKGTKWLLGGVGIAAIFELGRRWLNLPPPKYSRSWIQSLTDEQWGIEREIVRKNSCNSMLSDSEITYWERLRHLFDEVMSERKWAGRTPTAPSYPREHGHNLYKPD